jgi:PAS domain S-box-containing protein
MSGEGEAPGDPDGQDVYRLLVDETREVLCLHDVEGNFTFVSPSIERVLGYPPAMLIGRSPFGLVHEEDLDAAREALRSVMEEGESPILTSRFRRADGAWVWIEVLTRGLRNGTGEVTRLITSSRDVTQRVELLQKVSEREATLRSVIASFDDLVFVFDPEGRFREYYQPRERRNLFAPPEVFLGLSFEDTLPEEVAALTGTALELARRDGEMQEFGYELMIDGVELHFHAKITPMSNADGSLQGFVGVVRDDTERRAAEDARVALVRATERAERLEGLSVFARGTAHEFNNLLTTIQGNLALALDDLGTDGPGRAECEAAAAASERAAAVTRQLLAYAGESLGRPEQLQPAAIVRSVEAGLRPLLPDRVALQVEIDPETPEIEAEGPRLESALRHLLRNAFEALGADGGTVRVHVSRRELTQDELGASRIQPTAAPGTFAVFEVADDGEGIEPGILPRIFDPFMSNRFLGRGLGLAEVAGTVRSHHGAILVESDRGRGTSITMLLPAG